MVGACSGSAIEKSDGVIKVATPAYIGVTDDSDPCSCEFAAVSQLAKLRHLRILGEYACIFILNPVMACVSEYGRADAIVKVV